MKKIGSQLGHVGFLIVSLTVLLATSVASAQTYLRGAKVWQYDDGSIVVHYLGRDQVYTPDNGSSQDPAPPVDPRCSSQSVQPTIPGAPEMATVVLYPSRQTGGDTYTVDLSKYAQISAIQLKVARGAVQVHSATISDSYGGISNLNEFIVPRICDDQGITVTRAFGSKQKLVLKLEGYLVNDVALNVNIQYAPPTCGGCNQYGCWVSGGGCNQYGCYIPQGGCNQYGCYVPRGGCNQYGCYLPGGSCDQYGCQKPARSDAGRASSRPTCQ